MLLLLFAEKIGHPQAEYIYPSFILPCNKNYIKALLRFSSFYYIPHAGATKKTAFAACCSKSRPFKHYSSRGIGSISISSVMPGSASGAASHGTSSFFFGAFFGAFSNLTPST